MEMNAKTSLTVTAIAMLLAACASTANQQSAAIPPMTFFVTSTGSGKGADLGGMSGADPHCQDLAAAVGAGGLYIIPAKRRQAKKVFREKFSILRADLRKVLQTQLKREIDQSTERVQEAIGPYRRFIQLQQEQLFVGRDELVTAENDLLRLKTQIEKQL